MTAWGSNGSFYDDVELDHLGLLKKALPKYLALHEAFCGYLPENFNNGLAAGDPRHEELRRLGFLNYSILINALLVQRHADTADQLTGMLDVYGRTSAFFLRAGAAIDIAVPFEKSLGRVYQAGNMADGRGGTPHADTLKQTRLPTVDNYNNFLKHNGLPAVRLVDDGKGGRTVQVPDEITMRAALWSAQQPNAPLGTLLGCYAIEFLAAVNDFYAALLAASPKVLGGWGLTATATPAGIRTVLQQASSGSLPMLDGYQSSPASSYFLKWG